VNLKRGQVIFSTLNHGSPQRSLINVGNNARRVARCRRTAGNKPPYERHGGYSKTAMPIGIHLCTKVPAIPMVSVSQFATDERLNHPR